MAEIWVAPSRKYGLGKYGRNTYDHFRGANWTPEAPPTSAEDWVPISDPVSPWIGSAGTDSEIWNPITSVSTPWTPVNG